MRMVVQKMLGAAVPMSGAGDPMRGPLLLSTPVWAFHGAQDEVVPVSGARDMIAAIQSFGGSPLYTEYPHEGHNIWDQAYATPDLVSWTFSQQRATINISAVPEFSAAALAAAMFAALPLLYVAARPRLAASGLAWRRKSQAAYPCAEVRSEESGNKRNDRAIVMRPEQRRQRNP
jgi:hypothetical protein